MMVRSVGAAMERQTIVAATADKERLQPATESASATLIRMSTEPVRPMSSFDSNLSTR